MSWEILGLAMLGAGLGLYAVLYLVPGRIDALVASRYGDTLAQLVGLALVGLGTSLATLLLI